MIIGAANIAREIGENRHDIPMLVDRHGLPAWKNGAGKGTWRARPVDLDAWLERQRDARCPNHCLGAPQDSTAAAPSFRP